MLKLHGLLNDVVTIVDEAQLRVRTISVELLNDTSWIQKVTGELTLLGSHSHTFVNGMLTPT